MTRNRSPVTAPDVPFPYQDYLAAQQELLQAIEQAPFYGVLTGASGMGKSSLLRQLKDRLDRHRYQVVYLSSSRANVTNLTRFLATSLRVTPRRSHLETVQAVVDTLRGQPAHLLVQVDEADRVEPEVLQELRLLAECDGEQLFSVLLSGLPELLRQLDRSQLFPLKRRISASGALTGLRRDELDGFLAHHWGPDQERIPKSGRDELFERTRATPGLIQWVLLRPMKQTNGKLSLEILRESLDSLGL